MAAGQKKSASKQKPARTPRTKKEGGPKEWLVAQRLGTYARLVPRSTVGAELPIGAALEAAVAVPMAQDLWVDRLAEYKRRKVAAAPPAAATPGEGLEGAFVPGGQNWAPLGPSVVMNGQAQGNPPVGGRIAGLAVAGDGMRLYAASANGGVFRTDDGGMTWLSLMDAFDVDPTNFASTSLACGAIAIDPANPDRIYVGTGEGDTHGMFEHRIVHALPAYRGIGPIRSDDGGKTWVLERTNAGSAELAGKAFFALAVDPKDAEHVIAATTDGLYERVIAADQQPEWVSRRPNIHASVIVTKSGNAVRFYASEWGVGVFQSADGKTWSAIGTGFPATNTGRIALAAQSGNPRVVYALVATTKGALEGVYRLDLATSAWKKLSNPPVILPSAQGSYDLAIAVDPSDDAILYLGGSYANVSPYPASIWRCRVSANGSITSASIGVNAHADVHVLVHTPGDPNALWTGCDGGVFLNRDPRGSGIFAARNNGLACLCPNFIAQHPTDPNILFCGLQDNGTARTLGGTVWTRVTGGDGGYCLINWADPMQVLVYANGSVYRSTTGGASGWTESDFGFRLMTYPIVGSPMNLAKKIEGKIAALAAVDTVYVSNDFGTTWTIAVTIPDVEIYSLTFASPKRLFAGTTAGDVYRIDKGTSKWKATRIDDLAAGPLPLRGPISDIAVDWSDANRKSIYIAFGGSGDYRHVWRFNGTKWEARSGPANANNLLDVEHNAITVDPMNKNHVYAGADIGVWRSTDGGKKWEPLPNALPDAPVFDLQIHPSRRLLRAATHGRGLYEWTL
ncbi:MAG TPA: hypothetical protein VGQ36_19455 [Thermoanaerobaculia bacterium]|jgi:hypothetical protein|nr:hypothetical protein [Thermoanaerobaculia bacterium]